MNFISASLIMIVEFSSSENSLLYSLKCMVLLLNNMCVNILPVLKEKKTTTNKMKKNIWNINYGIKNKLIAANTKIMD